MIHVWYRLFETQNIRVRTKIFELLDTVGRENHLFFFFYLIHSFSPPKKKKKIIKKDEGKRNITHVGPIMGFRFYQDGLPNRRIPAHLSLRLSPCLNLRFFNISQQYTNQMMPRKIRPVDVDLPYDC